MLKGLPWRRIGKEMLNVKRKKKCIPISETRLETNDMDGRNHGLVKDVKTIVPQWYKSERKKNYELEFLSEIIHLYPIEINERKRNKNLSFRITDIVSRFSRWLDFISI